jgi:hypothetical protein
MELIRRTAVLSVGLGVVLPRREHSPARPVAGTFRRFNKKFCSNRCSGNAGSFALARSSKLIKVIDRREACRYATFYRLQAGLHEFIRQEDRHFPSRASEQPS